MIMMRLQLLLLQLLLLHLLCVRVILVEGAKNTKRRGSLVDYDAVRLTESKLFRFKRRIRESKVRKAKAAKSNQLVEVEQGSIFTLRKPTQDRIAHWFGGHGPTTGKRGFNHDMAGMTNPSLRIAVDDDSFPFSVDQDQDHLTVPVSLSTKEESIHDCWWPGTAGVVEKDDRWRRLRFVQRVGRGLECYQRVRDAALLWEFSAPTNNKGMMQIQLPAEKNQQPVHNRRFSVHTLSTVSWSDNVMQIWSGPARRFVTYTATGSRLFGWLPKLYAVNPVQEVYELLDQRGPCTTYSCTAYATSKGHLLCGEERVTVAFRDDTGFVDVEILSLSKPASSMKSKLVWPLIGRMQQRFFQDQLNSLEQVANSRETPERQDFEF
jgi:uncharacterized protein (UPF0548 family)